MNFHPAAPILRVADLTASLDYYVRVLGFQLDWKEPARIAGVSRGDCVLMLCEGDQGHPGAWAWIGVGDADALHDELLARGARIRHPPTDYAWARELQVEDLDGNVLRLGSEPRADASTGEWLDMQGHRWRKRPAGAWERVPS